MPVTALPAHGPPQPRPPSADLATADDSELAERAREDAEAFGVLYARYSAQVYRTVHHRLRDPWDAEDVTAEVFVKAYRAIGGYLPSRAPFWGWLHRIARNAVVDHVRARRPTVSLAAVADVQDATADVEGNVVLRSEATRAWRAVGTLCTTQRTAVTLRLAHDLPIAAIAGRMEISEGAVKQLINRGLSTVRETLVDRPVGDAPGGVSAQASSAASRKIAGADGTVVTKMASRARATCRS